MLVTSAPVSDWRGAADEGSYLRYAERIATGGVGAFPALVREFLTDPALTVNAPAPVRLTGVLSAALAVRWFGPTYRSLQHVSLVAFLALLVVVFVAMRRMPGRHTGGRHPAGRGVAARARDGPARAVRQRERAVLDDVAVPLHRGDRGAVATGLARRRAPDRGHDPREGAQRPPRGRRAHPGRCRRRLWAPAPLAVGGGRHRGAPHPPDGARRRRRRR